MKLALSLGPLCLVTTLTAAVSAAAATSEYTRFSFLKPNEQAKWARQASATIPLHMIKIEDGKQKRGMRCTAVFVGPNGEALTNLHCLEACITSAGLRADREVASGINTVSVTDPSSVRCPVKFGADLVEGELRLLKVFGPGWLSPRERLVELLNTNPKLLFRLLDAGYEAAGDLALVQLPVQQNECVPIRSASFVGMPGDSYALNLAYPVFMRRLNPVESLVALGTKLHVSSGRISGDRDFVREMIKGSPLAKIPELMLPRRTLMSSVDADSGSSGSPVFGEDGSLIAVIRSTWKQPGGYAPWMSQAISVSELTAEISRLVPSIHVCLR